MITSKEHPQVKHFMKLRINRDFRYETKKVLIEGEKLVTDVLKHLPYHHLFAVDNIHVPSADLSHVSIVTEEVMRKISGMERPPKFMAEVNMPPQNTLKGFSRVLVLDRLQDPGNLGTLFRTALALGWEGVFVLEDSVDPYNDKALRASQGAPLLMPWRWGTLADFLRWVSEEKIPVFLADLKGEPPRYVERGCLILGREGEGVHPELKAKFAAIAIASNPLIDSLNVAVAGGILMDRLRHP